MGNFLSTIKRVVDKMPALHQLYGITDNELEEIKKALRVLKGEEVER